MEPINYDETIVPDDNFVLSDAIEREPATVELGKTPLFPTPEAKEKYNKFIESLIEAQTIPEEDDNLLAAA